MINPTAVSKAATENRIKVINLPKASSRNNDPIIKLILTPNKRISRAKRTNNKLGFNMIIIKENKRNVQDNIKLLIMKGFSFMIIILKPNLLFVLFALEILLLGVNINFIMGSLFLDDALGKFITLILFSVAALDTAVGLIILINYYGLHTLTKLLLILC